MRLIDADILAEGIKKYFCNVCSEPEIGKCKACNIAEILSMIDDTPTIDAEPVKHGRWIIHREEIFEPNRSECYINRPLPTECSVCGFAEMRASRFAFCPNCGAKMDGDGT